jgi:hypothetical protein
MIEMQSEGRARACRRPNDTIDQGAKGLPLHFPPSVFRRYGPAVVKWPENLCEESLAIETMQPSEI